MDKDFFSQLSNQFTYDNYFLSSLEPNALLALHAQLVKVVVENHPHHVSTALQKAATMFSKTEPFSSRWKEKEIRSFLSHLPLVRETLIDDLHRIAQSDPASKGYEEILHAYPGFKAMVHYRIAHLFYQQGFPVVARIISEQAHSLTGIDIHPGAVIGRGCFIDHGTGVTIGETAVIGENVTIFHGVTLGVRSFSYDENGQVIRHEKRHPTIEEGVTIYANASILGGDTVVGKYSTIGLGVRLLKSVPPYSRIIPVSNIRSFPEKNE